MSASGRILVGMESAQLEPRADQGDLAKSENGYKLNGVTEAQVDHALKTLVLSPTVADAERKLKEDGHDISAKQLSYWRDHSFRGRYFRLRSELADEVGEELAGRSMERALQEDELEARAVQEAAERLSELDPRDLPTLIGRLSQAKASNIARGRLLRDKPTEIVERRSVRENLITLARLGLVEGEAIEIALEDAETEDP